MPRARRRRSSIDGPHRRRRAVARRPAACPGPSPGRRGRHTPAPAGRRRPRMSATRCTTAHILNIDGVAVGALITTLRDPDDGIRSRRQRPSRGHGDRTSESTQSSWPPFRRRGRFPAPSASRAGRPATGRPSCCCRPRRVAANSRGGRSRRGTEGGCGPQQGSGAQSDRRNHRSSQLGRRRACSGAWCTSEAFRDPFAVTRRCGLSPDQEDQPDLAHQRRAESPSATEAERVQQPLATSRSRPGLGQASRPQCTSSRNRRTDRGRCSPPCWTL